jgi:hypothetical protein
MSDPTLIPDVADIETNSVDSSDAADGIDPRGMLRPKMRVIGDAGRTLGRVDTLEYDAVSGFLNSLVVKHGLLGRTHTFVGAECVTQINESSVLLQISLNDFLALPTVEGR